jgi:hypothetical protein
MREKMKSVAGLFRDPAEAQVAVHDLELAGFSRSDISAITRKPAEGEEGPDTEDPSSTMKGAAIGSLAGVFLGVAALAIPGIGPILAAGPIAVALTGAGVGAATGGIISSLTHIGVSEQEAESWTQGVHQGGTLIIVHSTEENSDRARSILDRHGALNTDTGRS